jgi:hypothetical protein
MTPTTLRTILCLAALHAAAAHGQDSVAPQFSLSGYGTVGVIGSDEDRADYLVDAFKPNGPGRTRTWSGDADSRLGLQVSAVLNSQLSAVLQVLSQQRYDNTYRPSVEWANLKYQVMPDMSVRAGRVVLPIFMVTDTRRVGYANPWIRPPVELYSLVPVTTNDGVDASYRFVAAGYSNTVQLSVGRSDSKFPNAGGFEAGTAKVRNLVALNDAIERGFTTLRVSVGRASLTIDALRPLFDGFRQFGPAGVEIADKYSVDGRHVTFVGVGGSYDPGNWFAMGEWARFDTRSVVGKKSAWYVSSGYRINKKVTPYITYARIKADSNTSDPGLPLGGLPAQLVPVAAFLNGTLNAQLNLLPVQDTISVGARWDFAKNAALKVQYDHVKLGADSRGTFGNFAPDFQPGSKVRLFSAAVDFVF